MQYVYISSQIQEQTLVDSLKAMLEGNKVGPCRKRHVADLRCVSQTSKETMK